MVTQKYSLLIRAIFILFFFTVAAIYPQRSRAAQLSLLPLGWHLTASRGPAQAYQTVDRTILQNAQTIGITYNLHGLCLIPGDASAIIFDQNGWKYISLANYGKNCFEGNQTVTIPLTHFKDIVTNQPLNPNRPLTGSLHTRFWSTNVYAVDIRTIDVITTQPVSQANVTPSLPVSTVVLTPLTTPSHPSQKPTLQPSLLTPTPVPVDTLPSWTIKSVDAMKYTKDAVCSPVSSSWIDTWVAKAANVGANFIAISTPYDNPDCGDSVAYTKMWVNAIRSHGLHVWFRQMPLAFEGIYRVQKSTSTTYLDQIAHYIFANKNNYQSGDIFTPIPEPQNGGIGGVTYCPNNQCEFSSKEAFNQWLRDAMTISKNAFTQAGISGVQVGFFGFDGFIAWGDHNPDWHGILEDKTVQAMGNITIDHYPEAIGETMQQGLDSLQAKYPRIPIIIGEWGTVTGGNVVAQVKTSMGAAKRPNVIGFNYWQFGPGGSGEQLINSDFSSREQFSAVQSFYQLR